MKLKVQSFEFILGAAYIPCITSPFFFDAIWDQIHDDVAILKQLNLPFLITGDKNAHTSTLQDYLENDSFVADLTGCIILDEEESPEELFKSNPNCTPCRYNQDKMNVNSTGRNLISFCKTEKFKIVNGRVGSDKFLGNPTNFKGQPSVTDYVIACDDMFKRIVNFEVDVFDPNMSDVHAPISVSFHLDDLKASDNISLSDDREEDYEYEDAPNMKFAWNNNIKAEFIKSSLKDIDLQNLLHKMDSLESSPSQKSTVDLYAKS